ncbi:hypothetical protein OAG20_00795 [Verrucomicrobiales bacterium]|nr:hypothetical protein [Verrucomicrobiales bacterium]
MKSCGVVGSFALQRMVPSGCSVSSLLGTGGQVRKSMDVSTFNVNLFELRKRDW